MSSTTRSRLARGAVLAGTGALALSLVTAVAPASAIVATPDFAYLVKAASASDPAVDKRLYTAAATGDPGGLASPTATAATPEAYQVYGYDASWDGNTWAACMATGGPATNAYDRTYALALTHTADQTGTGRTADNTETRVLTTFCETAPVVSGDGSTVYWMSGNQIYKVTATYDGTTGAITPSATTSVSANQFVTAAGESIQNFTVSPDGTAAAVVYKGSGYYRIRVARLAATATGYSELKVIGTTEVPYGGGALAFTDNNTVVFDKVTTPITADTVFHAFKTTVPASAGGAAVAWADTALAGLNDVYDLQDYSTDNGTTVSFLGWKDTFTSGVFDKTTLYPVTDPAGTPVLGTPVDRVDGLTTYRYVPVAHQLPALESAVNRAAAHIGYLLHARATTESPAVRGLSATYPILRGAAMAYYTANLYLTGGTYSAAAAAETDKGDLQRCAVATCTDGDYVSVKTTSGASVFAIGSQWYMGTVVPASNLTYRWVYPGDFFTLGATSVAKRVYVAPTVSVSKAYSGTYIKVYGSARRAAGGKATLWRYTSTGWKALLTVTTRQADLANTTASFNFGFRTLPKGSYRVTAVGSTANGSWITGTKNFSI